MNKQRSENETSTLASVDSYQYLYGAEGWTVKKADEKRIESAEPPDSF